MPASGSVYEKRKNLSEGGLTTLQAAAIYGHLGIAHILLEANANARAAPAEFYGRTAPEGAAEHSRLDVLQSLLNAGTCHNRQDAE
jgi:ankyrin repeat protein